MEILISSRWYIYGPAMGWLMHRKRCASAPEDNWVVCRTPGCGRAAAHDRDIRHTSACRWQERRYAALWADTKGPTDAVERR